MKLPVNNDRALLLPLPARHERGEGWGEGQLRKRASSPRPSPPLHGGEGEDRQARDLEQTIAGNVAEILEA
jgi:hypothetical protein